MAARTSHQAGYLVSATYRVLLGRGLNSNVLQILHLKMGILVISFPVDYWEEQMNKPI